MNLEKEMEKQMCAKKNVCIPAYHIALKVAEQYGTEQRVAENNYWIDKEDVESDEVVFVRKNDFEKRIIELNERS